MFETTSNMLRAFHMKHMKYGDDLFYKRNSIGPSLHRHICTSSFSAFHHCTTKRNKNSTTWHWSCLKFSSDIYIQDDTTIVPTRPAASLRFLAQPNTLGLLPAHFFHLERTLPRRSSHHPCLMPTCIERHLRRAHWAPGLRGQCPSGRKYISKASQEKREALYPRPTRTYINMFTIPTTVAEASKTQ
jgi:hypothetical protein